MNADMLAGNIAAHWVQAAALAASAFAAMRLLLLREPRARLAALHLTLIAIVLLPVLQPWKPDDPAFGATPMATAMEAVEITPDAVASNAAGAAPAFEPRLAGVLLAAAGVVIRLLWLLYGVMRLCRFSRRAPDVAAPDIAGPIESTLGVSARYVQQAGSRGPWTFGFFRPTVALPAGFDALAPAFQRAVICHELVHVKRRDMAAAFLEELAVAALWFHPWIWLLRARIRVAREQIVDSRVVAILGNRDEYVRCLVDLSGHDLAPHFSQAGAGMLRPRELRARVDHIFQEAHMSRARFAFAAFAFVVVVIATGLVGAAAMPMRSLAIGGGPQSIVLQSPEQPRTTTARLNPAASSPINLQFKDARLRDVLAFIGHATSIVFIGYEDSFDQGRSVTIEATIDATAPVEAVLDRLLPPSGLTYTVTGPRTVVIGRSALAELRQAPAALERERRQINTVYPEYPEDALERGIRGTVVVDITVNPAGEVTTAAVASGPQELRASAFKAALGLKYTKGPSTVAMKVAFHYTLTDTSWGVRIDGGLTNMGTRFQMGQGAAETHTTLLTNPDETGAYRVGGSLQPPRKLKDAPPIYPPLAQEARVQGVVILEVRIDEQGMVSDVRTLRSIPLLDQAAIDAVKQWQYTPTLLNGVAVPVRMTVTVNFTLGPRRRIHLSMPDGNATELRAEVPTQVVLGDVRFHLVPSRAENDRDLKVSVFGEDGQTHLGDVVLVPDGPVVQSPTTPSFGMRLIVVP